MDIEVDVGEESPVEPQVKRHKKHKKKHKRKVREAEDEDNHGGAALMSPKTSIKLKLKIGGETMGTKNMVSIVQTPEGNSEPEELSEEEKWLDALEKGTLNSYGEIGTGKKDPSLLTARQKALLHGSQQDVLFQLPSGYKTVELTDEQKQRRQEKAKRRRQQANEKMENDKNLTVNKLLKKQDSKNKRSGKARGGKRSNAPRILYKNSLDGISISVPPDVPFPFAAQSAGPYPQPELCGVDGCSNPKTSVCSRSKVAICSLACYRKNLIHWEATQAGTTCPAVVEVT